MQDIFWTEKCVGCRACELACSYHHSGVFSPNIASIHIQRRIKEGQFGIVLYRQAEGEHLACSNGCDFCLKYCPVVARDELKAILQGKKTPEVACDEK